jgi:hypothetical protein
MKLLRVPFILVLFIVTFIDATIHNGLLRDRRFGFLADVGFKGEHIMLVMSLRPVAEIATMAILGGVLAKFGWRTTMIVRHPRPRRALCGVCLIPAEHAGPRGGADSHGICYAFFFATVYIFIDAAFPQGRARLGSGACSICSSLGFGDLAAKWLFVAAHELVEVSVVGADGVAKTMIDYPKLFMVPVGLALFAAVLLLMAFHPPKEISASGNGGGAAPH